MRVLKLREKLSKIGLVLMETGKGTWLVTNNGTAKTLFERGFTDLAAVELWLESPARRLSDAESDEFDADWVGFIKLNQCDGCRRGLPLEGGIHFGEGWDMIACTRGRYEQDS